MTDKLLEYYRLVQRYRWLQPSSSLGDVAMLSLLAVDADAFREVLGGEIDPTEDDTRLRLFGRWVERRLR